MATTNLLMDHNGNIQEISMEPRGRLKARHGNTNTTQQQLGTTRINIKLQEPRQQLDHVSTFLLDGWMLMHDPS